MQKLLFSFLLVFASTVSLHAQYNYTLSWDNPNTHLYQVSLEATASAGGSTDFQIAAWRPGRYIEQNFAAAVSEFKAMDENGAPLKWMKTDKDTWKVTNPPNGKEPVKIVVKYQYYANVMDAGSSVLNAQQAYFNGSNLFMHVRDRYAEPCTLTVASMPVSWKSGTSLTKGSAHNIFMATDYHEFVDCPTILSPTLHSFSMQLKGATFWFHFQGGFTGGKATEDKLMADAQKVFLEQAALFGGNFPFTEYHFITQLLSFNMRHAVEHKYSSCYALPQTIAQSPAHIASMYSILSHEFFHLWNVKRIRPASLWPYDYQHIQYTSLHWFTEGVTDYYTSLAMVRAGVMSRPDFCKGMSDNITSLENEYANKVVSPSDASFNSWLVRSAYMNPNANTSYYPLGERVGLLLDLEMRRRSEGKHSLDEVMEYLWKNNFQQDMGVPEDGVQKAVETLCGESYSAFFDGYVIGVKPIDYETFFKPFGFEMKVEDAVSGYDRIGITDTEKTPVGIYLSGLRPDGDAVKAGLSDGDVLQEINGSSAASLKATEFFGGVKKNDKLAIKALRGSETLNITVVVSEATAPKVYTMTVQEKLNKKEQGLQDGLFAPKVR
jgi:predicted metalloprotease with PDZ domain